MAKFKQLETRLRAMTNSANITCRDFTKLLREFGFKVTDGASGGHKVVTHPALTAFHGTNYNCGHNPGTHVGRPYIKQLAKVVEEYSDELKEFLT